MTTPPYIGRAGASCGAGRDARRVSRRGRTCDARRRAPPIERCSSMMRRRTSTRRASLSGKSAGPPDRRRDPDLPGVDRDHLRRRDRARAGDRDRDHRDARLLRDDERPLLERVDAPVARARPLGEDDERGPAADRRAGAAQRRDRARVGSRDPPGCGLPSAGTSRRPGCRNSSCFAMKRNAARQRRRTSAQDVERALVVRREDDRPVRQRRQRGPRRRARRRARAEPGPGVPREPDRQVAGPVTSITGRLTKKKTTIVSARVRRGRACL